MALRNVACVVSAVVASLAASAARGQVNNPEVEGNDSKATATVANSGGPGMSPGDTISGQTTSATLTGLDYFRVRTASAPLGIYRHRLALASATPGHTATIRGLSQNAAAADTATGIPWNGVIGTAGAADNTAQTGQIVGADRVCAWYGFGKGEEVFYRVTGTASTTASYTATLDRQSVSVTPIGSFIEGLIRMNWNGQGHTTDTDIWVYDANFNAIPGFGNDDSSATLSGAPIATTSLQSWLARPFTPGTYYLAVSNFSFLNHQPAASDDNFRTGSILDFPDAAVNSSTTANLNVAFTMQDDFGTTIPVASTRSAAFDINWFVFQVLPSSSPTNPTGVGAASPAAGQAGDAVVFTVTVNPGTNPPSTGLAVGLDASAINAGGLVLLDDGFFPDQIAGDLVFTAGAIVGPGATLGNQSLPFAISDLEGRTGLGSIAFRVYEPPTVQFDFGNLSAPDCRSGVFDLALGEVKWFRFSLSTAADAGLGTFLDIDTEGTAGCADMEIGVYRSDGTLVATDDDDGSGLQSQLTFGAGTRPAINLCTSLGQAYNGRDGMLGAGVYYLAAGRFNTVFNLNAFEVTSTGPAVTGAVVTLCSRPPAGIVAAGAANPNPVIEGQTVTLTVTVDPADVPPSTGVTVVVDATTFSGGLVALLDDGAPPDAMAGDNVFSGSVIAAPMLPGLQSLPFHVADGQGREFDGTIALTVFGSPMGACCARDNTCTVERAFVCLSSGGAFAGPGTNCFDNPCVNACGGGPKLFEQIDFGNLTGQLVSQSTNNCPGCLLSISSWSCIDDFEINGLEGVLPTVQLGRVEALVRNTGPLEPIRWRVKIHTTRQSAETQVIGNQYHEEFEFPSCRIPNYSPQYPGFELVAFDLGTGIERSGSRDLVPGQYWMGVVAVTDGDQPDVLVALGNINDGADGPDAFLARYVSPQAPVQTTQNAAYRIRVPTEGPGCAVDFNQDGNLDPDDLGDFINCYFSVPPCGQADFNGDGNVDPDDLGDFINGYFAGCG